MYWAVCNVLSLWALLLGEPTLIARFMGPTWGPSGADRTHVGPIWAPWTLLSGLLLGEQYQWISARKTLAMELCLFFALTHRYCIVNSLAPGRHGRNSKNMIFQLLIQNSSMGTHWEIAVSWMSQNCNIDSGNGLVLSGNKLTQIFVTIWHH